MALLLKDANPLMGNENSVPLAGNEIFSGVFICNVEVPTGEKGCRPMNFGEKVELSWIFEGAFAYIHCFCFLSLIYFSMNRSYYNVSVWKKLLCCI